MCFRSYGWMDGWIDGESHGSWARRPARWTRGLWRAATRWGPFGSNLTTGRAWVRCARSFVRYCAIASDKDGSKALTSRDGQQTVTWATWLPGNFNGRDMQPLTSLIVL
jgi:hypothetical protein